MMNRIKEYLPSRKLTAFFIVPVITILLLFVSDYIFSKYIDSKNNKYSVEEIINKDDIDTDNDGLKDWEEELAGTKIDNKDTDGDGFSDGLEVKTGSDPLDPLNRRKKEEFMLDKIDESTYNYKLDPELTSTDRLAYEFLEQGFGLKKDGMASNKDAQNDVINNLISKNRIQINLQTYSLKDLNIDNNISKEEFKKNLISVLTRLKNKKLIEETFLLNTYLYNNYDKKYLNLIQENTKVYKYFISMLINLKVPKEISESYLSYINAFQMVVDTNDHYADIERDPVIAAQAMGIYKETDGYLENALGELSKKLNK